MIISILARHKKLFFVLILLILLITFFGLGVLLYQKVYLPKVFFPTDLQTRALLLSENFPEVINHDRVQQKLQIASNKTLTDEERYQALDAISFLMGVAYSDSSNPEFRKYTADLGEYAKKAYPNLYKEGTFKLACHDPSCAPLTPREIETIISKINSSTLTSERKKEYTRSLKSISFLEEVHDEEKASFYFGLAEDLKKDAKITTSSAILDISNELSNFVKKTYPKSFNELQKSRDELIKKYGEQP